MLYFLAGAPKQIANLVNFNPHIQEDCKYLMLASVSIMMKSDGKNPNMTVYIVAYIKAYMCYLTQQYILISFYGRNMGAQWLSGGVLDLRLKGPGFEAHRRHCVVSLSKNINPSLVLVQPRKTCPFISERLLLGHKESNQTNKMEEAYT